MRSSHQKGRPNFQIDINNINRVPADVKSQIHNILENIVSKPYWRRVQVHYAKPTLIVQL